MKKHGFIGLVFCVALFTGCQNAEAPKMTESEKQDVAQSVVDQADGNAILGEVSGDIELEGTWQDEISERATMSAARNADGSYDIEVSWANSADETASWRIHGTYDSVAGMLGYGDGEYVVRMLEYGKEIVSGPEVTAGVFTKSGEKLIWIDSKVENEAVFSKVE